MRIKLVCAIALLCATSTSALAGPGVIRYVSIHQASPRVVIVDTRAAAQCQHRSLAGAHCLPATDLLGPSGELPNFADIFWALGTAGLDGRETVLVAGDQAEARDFVAGVLYLSGQAKVDILRPALSEVLRKSAYPSGQGIPRAILRQRIYRATMRDAAMVLPGELKQIRRHQQKLVYIDAANAAHDQSMRNNPRDGSHELQIIYARSVRHAIARFIRMLARRGNAGQDIRVVPVSVTGQVISAKRNPPVHQL